MISLIAAATTKGFGQILEEDQPTLRCDFDHFNMVKTMFMMVTIIKVMTMLIMLMMVVAFLEGDQPMLRWDFDHPEHGDDYYDDYVYEGENYDGDDHVDDIDYHHWNLSKVYIFIRSMGPFEDNGNGDDNVDNNDDANDDNDHI